ncbi:SigB/SigF/SigG family RNA polymerase sigma factor [Streptomyces sp. NPDC047123]|uniref:SigB/SigF/SigG family RNA polymerase sigma factor n=1 Tax=Streptomyces sp. NPDC047123 TaxID=3155622 RepID=UPI0033E807ED
MTGRHPHDDSPDTAQAFRHLAAHPAGHERDVLTAGLVESWLPMARRLARKFRQKGESQEDLDQVAALGLMKAIERYDVERGAFESYAIPTITGELRRHFRDHSWDVHVPRRIQELRNKVRATHQDLISQPGHAQEPGFEELAVAAGLTVEEVRDGMRAWNSHTSVSLDFELGEPGNAHSLADTLGAAEPGYDLATDREAARAGLAGLPRREREILYLRFFEDQTQSQIAEHMGVSQMHISRLISKSCAQVRHHAQTHPTARQAA